MYFRAFAAALTALLLTFAPTAAFAYGEDSGSVTVEDSNPAVGQVFGVSIESEDCRVVRLKIDSPRSETTIDGKQTNSRTKPADADGTTDFEASIGVEGEFVLTGYCVSAGNEVLGEQMTIVVGDGEVAGTTADTREAGLLPDTGAESSTTALTVGGGLLILAGAATLLIRRRKSHAG